MALIDDNPAGELGRLVGYGFGGLGSTGPVFGDPATAPGFRRGAENIIDRYYSSSNLLVADFDEPPSSPIGTLCPYGSKVPVQYEGSTAPGDSGGPLMVERQGEWFIVGVTNTGGGGYCGTASWASVLDEDVQGFMRHYGKATYVPVPAGVFLLATGLVFPLLMLRLGRNRG